MSRIYFDSNVYSKLRNNQSEKYQTLNTLLEQYKNNLTFFFSIAHIRDKKSDTSELKFADFDFIESFTKDNYLAYHPIEKKSSFYLATPKMVYQDDLEDNFDVRSVLDLFKSSDDDEPIMKAAKELMGTLADMPIFDNIQLEGISEDQKAIISKVLPANKPTLTMREMMTNQIDLYEDMMTNHQTYKDLRKIVDEGFNNGRFTLNNRDIDFNLAFKDSGFNKSFFEYVRDSLNKKPDEKMPIYDFYMQAYHCLDLLGISKDKITKKNNYNNLLNDAMHSYFGQYCDYYVSEDKRSLVKSEALYNQFDFKTKTLTLDEFIELLPSIGIATEQSAEHFFDKLSQDIEHGERGDSSETDFGYQRHLYTKQRFLNFFDLMLEVKEDEKFHYMIRKMPEHWLSPPNYREQGAILDRCIILFGDDIHQLGLFNFDKEKEEIHKGTWPGRYWKFGNILISLQQHHALNEFCLIITVLSSNPEQKPNT